MNLSDLTVIRPGLAMAGRAAGARPGDWRLRVVESADIVEDRLSRERLREIAVRRNARTEAHLLHPFDLLVTARSQSVKVALVPPDVSRAVAAATLLVVRTPDPGTGLAHFLWYYLSSARGRAEVAARVTATSLPTLSARALGDVPVTAPPAHELLRLADFIEAAEASRSAALDALRVRHDLLRDAIIGAAAAPDRDRRTR